MQNFLKQLLEFFRNFLNLGGGSNWDGHSRLVRTPEIPRSQPQLRTGSNYAGLPERKRQKFSDLEVKRVLQGREQGDRARFILSQAALIGSLLDERMIKLFPGRERIFEKLPFIVQQYSMGRNKLEIARSVSYFADEYDIEDVVDFACRVIANHLNRQR